MIQRIAVVSLSNGTIGEDFVKHEVDIGISRRRELGVKVTFMPHALKGIDYVKAHPEKRAADLLQALKDPEIDMILFAIGGDDTYRLLPSLFTDSPSWRTSASWGRICLPIPESIWNGCFYRLYSGGQAQRGLVRGTYGFRLRPDWHAPDRPRRSRL